jgi:phospholipid-translocating ATPase
MFRHKSRRGLFRGEGSRFFSRPKKGTKEELPAPERRRDSKADEVQSPIAGKDDKGRSQRRNIYFNRPMPQREKKSNGDPMVRYARNKVRTTSRYASPLSNDYLTP